jgi:tetratricopeptide (TPR) repeat protein
MRAFGDPNDLLFTARALAARGAWTDLLGVADAQPSNAHDPEIAVLCAEARLRVGQPAAAWAALEQLIPRLQEGGARSRALLRRAWNLSGAAGFALGRLDEAADAFGQAIELAAAARDHLLMARATNNLGAIANIHGQREVALSRYKHCVAAYQRLGSAVGLAETHHNIAITYRDLQQYQIADECEQRAIEYAREAGNARLAAMARTGRAELSFLQGDARLAEAEARMAAREFAEIPDPVSEADALRLVGQACTATHRLGDALSALDRATTLAHDHGNALMEAEALHARACAWVGLADLERAAADATAALEIFSRLGAQKEMAEVEALLARIG